MSKYSQKLERDAEILNKQAKKEREEARKQAEIEERLKEERRNQKRQRKALEAEKGMVRETLARFNALDEEAREEEEERLTPLRQRRKAYLESLGSGNIKIIQPASQTLFGYIVGEQMERQDKEKKEEQKRKQKQEQEQETSKDETR